MPHEQTALAQLLELRFADVTRKMREPQRLVALEGRRLARHASALQKRILMGRVERLCDDLRPSAQSVSDGRQGGQVVARTREDVVLLGGRHLSELLDKPLEGGPTLRL